MSRPEISSADALRISDEIRATGGAAEYEEARKGLEK